MIITLQNMTKSMRVYQLDQRVASGAFKSTSETAVRVDHDKAGNANVRRVRLRHGPVLRIRAGEQKEVPAALLYDKKLRKDTIGSRPPLKIVRRETAEQHDARLAAEAADKETIARERAKQDAAQAAKDAANKAKPEVKAKADAPKDKKPKATEHDAKAETAGSAPTTTKITE